MTIVNEVGAKDTAGRLTAVGVGVGVGVEGDWAIKRYLQVSGSKEPSDGFLPQVTQLIFAGHILQDYRN